MKKNNDESQFELKIAFHSIAASWIITFLIYEYKTVIPKIEFVQIGIIGRQHSWGQI